MKLRELMTVGMSILKENGISTAESDIRVLIMHLLGIGYTDIIMKYEDDIDEELCNSFIELVSRRKTHEPCQYITGNQEFMGYGFHVEKGVLIPRPETEILVEEALKLTENRDSINALDMCCGSGCIGISYKLFRDKQGKKTDMTLADISDKAINVSTYNNDNLRADCRLVQTDLFENITGKFDIILSNPPYIKTSDISELMEEVRDYEPSLALDGREDGLFFYRKIIDEAKKYLLNNGIIIFEIGYDQYEDIKD
ncbi:MAG: peptide chain release factor N(5)-glutamine methyltransferase, partial [Wujia sp.]